MFNEYLTLPNIQQICSKRLWKCRHLPWKMDSFWKWKYDYWIELKTWYQMEKLLIMSHTVFKSCLLHSSESGLREVNTCDLLLNTWTSLFSAFYSKGSGSFSVIQGLRFIQLYTTLFNTICYHISHFKWQFYAAFNIISVKSRRFLDTSSVLPVFYILTSIQRSVITAILSANEWSHYYSRSTLLVWLSY